MRRLVDRALPLIAAAALLLVLAILGGIMWVLVEKGGPALSWSFFTEQIALVGASGGILWNLVGTLLLLTTALVVCLPLAGGVALLRCCYLPNGALRKRLSLLMYVMNGMPSILFGLFGLIVFVRWLDWGKSWLSGGILLGLMMLPTAVVAFAERIDRISRSTVDAAYGLGLSKAQVVWSVIVPQARGGLISGCLLGLARAAGETAPIMFTATIFAGATFPKGVHESPVLSLPYHIFILAQDSFDPGAGSKLWGAALVLLGLVFSLSLAALPLRLRTHDSSIHE